MNAITAKHYHDWHEDDGPVLWWLYPIGEPPYSGTPLDDNWPFSEGACGTLFWTELPGVQEITGAIGTYVDTHQDIIARYPTEEGMGL